MLQDPQRVKRFREIVGDGEPQPENIASEEFAAHPSGCPLDRFLLVERSSHDDSIFVTSWDDPNDAADYHDNQKEPDNWRIEALYDLDSDDVRTPVASTSWEAKDDNR